jgi:D-alanyl-D-alanine carboxypeptidase
MKSNDIFEDGSRSNRGLRSWSKSRVICALVSAAVGGACGVEVDEPLDTEDTVRETQALSANDCQQGKGCAAPTVTFGITPQVPSLFGGNDYCTDRKCKRGEGDCDSDSECETGLRCVTDRGAFVGLAATVDICWPTDRICTDLGPCVHGEGDCDLGPGRQGPRQCVENTVCKNLTGETDECRTREPDDLTSKLAGFSVNAPGFGAAVFDQEGTVAIGFKGVRKFGETAALRRSDRFHLGSNTKAMTGTLAAVLVDSGDVRWTEEDTWHPKHSGYSATFDDLQDLLDHRSGVTANSPLSPSGSLSSQREQITRDAWATAPAGTPGQYLYSNLGFQMAAHVMEHETGQAYETMMSDRMFRPLGMSSCAFGPSPDVSGHTKGMVRRSDGVEIYTFIPNNGDNPRWHNSSGRAHCNLDDWGKFLREHLRGADDRSALLPKELYEDMQTNPGTGYRAGWVLTTYKGDLAIWHNGSNTLNYSEAMVVPARKIAVAVVANSAVGDMFGNVSQQTNAILMNLLNTYAP